MKASKVFVTFLLVAVVAIAMLGIAAPGVKAQSETITINIKESTLTDHECDLTEWHIIINQISEESLAPASIHVWWANGDDKVVPLEKFTPGGVAHYSTTDNLDSQIVSATAVIYSAWDGQFNLSHGPCLEEETPTEPTEPTQPTEPTNPTQPTDPGNPPTATNPRLGAGRPDDTNNPSAAVPFLVLGAFSAAIFLATRLKTRKV